MSRNRLRHRVEIAVQKIDDVIARPVVRDPGEIAQIADHDGSAYRRSASAPSCACQNELAGMRPDIGFEQRAPQASPANIILFAAHNVQVPGSLLCADCVEKVLFR
jgi:hypothetical protein